MLLTNFNLLIISGKKHVQCLGELEHQDKETIQTVLACHLFAPLLLDGKVFVDHTNGNLKETSQEASNGDNDDSRSRSESSVLEVKCPFCKQTTVKAGNTNFGKYMYMYIIYNVFIRLIN